MDDEEFEDFCTCHGMFLELNKAHASHPLLKDFSKCRHASFVFCSNRLENTISNKVRQSDAFKLLESLYDDGDSKTQSANAEVVPKWNSDGNPYTKTQMVQHLKAFKYLCSFDKLTKDVILETHKILMNGAFINDHKGQVNNILNGKLRTFGVNNGVEDYMPFWQVESSIDNLVKSYNDGDKDQRVRSSPY